MKFFHWLGLIAAGVLGASSGCAQENTAPALLKKPTGKVLIVFYSQSNTRNTATVAQWIHEQVGGDMLEITPVKPYSDNYFTVLSEVKKQRETGELPEIAASPINAADYDLIFLGSPIWYGTFAPPVGAWLKGQNLAGKVIAPFCTHGGGGDGTFAADLAAAAPQAKILPMLTIKGHNVVERMIRRGTADKSSPAEVVDYLNQIISREQ